MAKTHRASIDARFLDKVDRIFDASPLTVFQELLQNSRRAGASDVFVTFTEGNDASGKYFRVEFNDNGKGLEDPAPLLKLAGQGWDDETEAQEDPAGMGFFCLSNFETVRVWSRDWRATFTPEVFRGQADLIEEPAPPAGGTSIEWIWRTSESAFELRHTVQRAAAHCDLERVTITGGFNNDPVVVIPEPFLTGCEVVTELPRLGINIGVMRHAHAALYSRPSVRLNFYGVKVDIQNTRGDDSMGYLHALAGDSFDIRVDVRRATALQLVLPARNALKHNQGRLDMLYECERLAYAWISQNRFAQHTHPYHVYKRAQEEFKIDIGEAKFDLSPTTHSYGEGSRARVLSNLEVDMIPGCAYFIEQLCRTEDNQELRLYEPSRAMEGYSWYDQMIKVEAVTFLVGNDVIDNTELVDGYQEAHPKGLLIRWVDSLLMRVGFASGNVMSVSLPCLTAGEKVNCFYNIDHSHRIFLSRALENDRQKLFDAGELVVDFLFDPDEDGDSEPADVQRGKFDTDITSALLELIGDDQGAARQQIYAAARAASLDYVIEDTWAWSIHREAGKNKTWKLFGPYDTPACRKRVTMLPGGMDASSSELISTTPITPERVANYLVATQGFAEEADAFVMEDYDPPVDLDAWELANAKQGEQ